MTRAPGTPPLTTVVDLLDGIAIAACLFDLDDCALAWNRSFLALFPEHDGALHVGEPYRDNLRRFYQLRLAAEERAQIERYIEEGLARHRAQFQPYSFEHRGRQLRVASLPIEGMGRLRVWRDETPSSRAPALTAVDAGGLFDGLADGVMASDEQGRIVWANQSFARLYRLPDPGHAVGLAFDTVYRRAWADAGADDDPAALQQGLAVLADNLRFVGAPFELPLPADRWVRVVAQQAAGAQRHLVHVECTAFKRQQRELAQAEALLREKTLLLEATLERMEQGVMMVSAERVVQVCNRRAIELLDLPPDLMRTRPRFEDLLAHPWSKGEFAKTPADIRQFISGGGFPDQAHTCDRTRPDGRVIEIQSVPIAGGGVLRTYTDITDRRRSEERIRHLARHDGLTSLFNREVLLEHLAGALERLAAAGGAPAAVVAVHYIDLDGFKPVNDLHGHLVGDKLLALVAQRLRHAARDNDVVARMGGDEFAILQQQLEPAQAAQAAQGLAERVLQSLRRPFEIEALEIGVGASIGIALAVPGEQPDALLRRADAAMYAAKARGRNAVQLAR